MTAPRQILPDATYLVTRRCSQRQFLLRPSKMVNEVFSYLLAVAAERYAIDVHAYCVLSNHFHLLVTDRHARLPAFHQFLDGLVARALNAWLGRWESFWAPNSYSAVRLVSPEDVVSKAAYALANPVAAGLVRSGRDWPGLWSAPELVGAGPREVARPTHFFSPRGTMPAKASLALVPPPGFASAEDFRDRVAAELTVLAAKAVAERKGEFLGARKVLAQKPTCRPLPGEPRRVLNPRIGARDKWKRIEALGRLVEFLAAYRVAFRALRAGLRDVRFPAGTYRLRVLGAVACEGAG